MSTKLKAGTATSGAVIDADTTGILELQSGSTPTTAVTINASQNVGIGTASPQATFDVNGTSQFRSAMALTTDNYLYSYNGGVNGQVRSGIYFDGTNQAVNFYTASGEKMRLTSNGNLLINKTSANSGANNNLEIDSGFPQVVVRSVAATAGRYWYTGMSGASEYIVYANGSTGVYLSWNATSWTAGSDERLKADLKPIENAVDKVTQLRSVTGRYKTDEEGTSRSFLIAQDVQKVFPEAVDVKDDELRTLGVRYTEVIPLLVAAIKELKAEVDALKGAK